MTPADPTAEVESLRELASVMTVIDLPPEDRLMSPHTGMTRDHWLAIADDLLLAAARYQSAGGARFDFPGRPSQQGTRTDALEGFARTFLLAAFRSGGDRADDPHGHLERYRRGVVSGTRSPGAGDEESWPVIGHVGRHGQSHVEAASIALSLHITRTSTWELMTGEEQDRVVSWLRAALPNEPASNNWYLFPLTIASFLEAVGRADEETSYVIGRGIDLIDQWYRGDGWYSDGDGQAFDHYVGWALHLYPLLHAGLRGDSELAARLGARLHEFLDSFSLTFDSNGAPAYLGRSMTYRMATLAAIAMGEVTGHTPLSHGQSRRILSAGLRYFLERGATVDGILSLGWHGEHEPSLQRYSGPGSPYWASKGFAALLLPAEHAVWTEREDDLEIEGGDIVTAVAPAGLLVQRTADGIARVHNHGSDHLKPQQGDSGAPDPLYARFAYGTRTGPTAPHNVTDNDVQASFRGVWSVRRKIHMVGGGENWMASWHAPRFAEYGPFEASEVADGGPVLPSVRIESVTAARGRAEVRITRAVGLRPGSALRLSGWAVAGARPESLTSRIDGAEVTIAQADGLLTSQLVGIVGWTTASTAIAPHGTAFGRWAVVPELRAVSTAAPMVAIASLTAELLPEPATTLATVSVDGAVVVIDWSDGTSVTTIDLDGLDWE